MSAIIEFLSKLWSPRSNNRGSRSDSRRGGGERKAGNNRTIKPEKEASRWIFYIICWSKTKWCYSGKKKKKELGLLFFSPPPILNRLQAIFLLREKLRLPLWKCSVLFMSAWRCLDWARIVLHSQRADESHRSFCAELTGRCSTSYNSSMWECTFTWLCEPHE